MHDLKTFTGTQKRGSRFGVFSLLFYLILKFYVPSTRTRIFFLKTEIFFSVLTFLQHNDVFGNQKRRCSETVPKVKISENVGFSFSRVDRQKLNPLP